MSDQSKTSKRLGIVGAAAVVGLVPISMLAASPAFAVSPGTATLSISPTTVTSTSTATNGFTTNNALASGGTITINSLATSGTPEVLPTVAAGTALAGSGYTVTFGSTTVAGTVTSAAGSATITVTTPIPTNTAVTVAITGVHNSATPSTVYFQDDTSADTTSPAVDTNVVSIGNAVSTTATVSQVNPTAYTDAGGEPFTITGSNFNPTATNPPVVCFVQSGTAVPAGGTATNPCTGTGLVPAPLGPLANQTSSQLQGTSPGPALLSGGKTYNVVVYNWNDAATPAAAYTGPSAVSGTTLVGVHAGLNFVPESGIRAVDSRTGLGLPKGSLTPKLAYAIPATAFENSPAVPTNVPTTATGLSLNVTAVGPTGPGNLQVWSVTGTTCGTAPSTSSVNFQPPQDTNNTTVQTFTAAGSICVQDNGASVPVVMDVTGYTTAGFAAAPTTARLLDTRSGTGGLLGPLPSGKVFSFNTGLAAGTPVALNVTAVAPSSVGNLRLFPEPATGVPAVSGVPTTSVITYIPGTDASSMYVTQVGANGNMDLYSAGTGTVNVVIDEIGSLASSSLTPLATPFRIYDSRPGGIAAGGTATVTASPSGSGSVFVPAGSLGVVGDIGDINPAAAGNLRTFPAGGAVPGTSTINNFPMQTRSTSGVVALNPSNGQFSIYSAGSSTNSTFDVTGYIPGT